MLYIDTSFTKEAKLVDPSHMVFLNFTSEQSFWLTVVGTIGVPVGACLQYFELLPKEEQLSKNKDKLQCDKAIWQCEV